MASVSIREWAQVLDGHQSQKSNTGKKSITRYHSHPENSFPKNISSQGAKHVSGLAIHPQQQNRNKA